MTSNATGESNELDINYQILLGMRAANQQISDRRRFKWIGIILHRPGNQAAFTHMTNTTAAREAYGNITGFREFQQTLEFRFPRNRQAGARKRDSWTLA